MSFLSVLLSWLWLFIFGSIWYIAITWLLFLIWRELRLIRMK